MTRRTGMATVDLVYDADLGSFGDLADGQDLHTQSMHPVPYYGVKGLSFGACSSTWTAGPRAPTESRASAARD